MGQIGSVEEVAGVGVARHQPQRLRSPTPPTRIGGCGRLSGRRGVERLGQAVVLALVRAGVAGPHLVGDLQRLLQPLEPLGQRAGTARPAQVLALVPGRADAEPGATAGEHVEGGDGLDEDAGMAIGDAGDERAELDPLRDRPAK